MKIEKLGGNPHEEWRAAMDSAIDAAVIASHAGLNEVAKVADAWVRIAAEIRMGHTLLGYGDEGGEQR